MKKKALIIAYNGLSKVGGVQNVIYQTIISLSNEFCFDVIVFNSDDYYIKKLASQGINCVKTIKIVFPLIYKYLGASFRQRYTYRFAKALFNKKKYDVVHSFKELDSWPFLKAAYSANIPIRILHNNVVHSFNNINARSKWRLLNSRKKSLKYATNFVAASKHCGDILYSRKPYSVIYNTFDSSKYYIDTTNSSNLSIIQVGIFCQNKNQLFTIDIFSKIKKIINNSFLTLIGYEVDHGYLNKIMNKIQNEGLTDSVKIIDGRNEDADKYVRQSTFLLLPSFYEGASIVAIEAQACGIHVFASTNISTELDCGGLKRIDIDKNYSSEEWAKMIIDTFKSEGNKRHYYNLKQFSFKSFESKIKKLYKQI